MKRLVVLDGLRGMAALVVVLHHALTLFPGMAPGLAGIHPWLAHAVASVAHRNVDAVLFFFVLSGFSIRLSLRGRSFEEAVAVRHYFTRRARRILPLYLLALLLAWAVSATVAPAPGPSVTAQTLLGNLLFLQTAMGVPGQWFVPFAANGPLWSLSFEVFYYLTFPLLWRAVSGRRARMIAVLAASTAGHALGALSPNPFTMFLSSWVIWYLGVDLAERHLGERGSVPDGVLGALAAGVAVLRFLVDPTLFHGPFMGFVFYFAGRLFVGRLFAERVAQGVPATVRRATVRRTSRRRGATAARRVLSLSAWVGGVSYGLYVLHVPVMRALAALGGPGIPVALVAIALSIVTAWAAERAAAWLLDRVDRRRRPRTPSPPAASGGPSLGRLPPAGCPPSAQSCSTP